MFENVSSVSAVGIGSGQILEKARRIMPDDVRRSATREIPSGPGLSRLNP